MEQMVEAAEYHTRASTSNRAVHLFRGSVQLCVTRSTHFCVVNHVRGNVKQASGRQLSSLFN